MRGAGGNAAAQSEAISRLISIALRSGIDPLEIIRELKGISGPNPVWESGELILSTPDAIGKAIERHVKRQEEMPEAATAVIPSASEARAAAPAVTVDAPQPTGCMEGDPVACSNVVHESGCLTCKQCGWSKC